MNAQKWMLVVISTLGLSVGLVQATGLKAPAAPVVMEQAQTTEPGEVEEPNGAPDNDAVEQNDPNGADEQCGPQDANGQETPDANEPAEGADTDTAQDCK